MGKLFTIWYRTVTTPSHCKGQCLQSNDTMEAIEQIVWEITVGTDNDECEVIMQ